MRKSDPAPAGSGQRTSGPGAKGLGGGRGSARAAGGRGQGRVGCLGASRKGPTTDKCCLQTPASGKGGRQVSWSGAFAGGAWEGGASGSDGDDESGGKPPRRPLSAQLMVKVASWNKNLTTGMELGGGGRAAPKKAPGEAPAHPAQRTGGDLHRWRRGCLPPDNSRRWRESPLPRHLLAFRAARPPLQ